MSTPPRRRQLAPALLAAALALGACTEEPESPTAPVETRTDARQQLAAEGTLAGEQSFLELARSVPAFGGYYFDEQGEIVVYLTTPQAANAARAAIRGQLQARAHPRNTQPFAARPINVRHADYSFIELARFRTKLRRQVFAVPGVVSLGVKESKNRVDIGVEEPSAKAKVKSLLAELEIPEAAVIFSRRADAELSGHTLDNTHPDTVVQGGLNADGCSIGFPATRNGIDGFVIASHCTEVMYGLDGETFSQPTLGPQVGTEHVDPPPLSAVQCFDPDPCRHSDAAFIEASVPLDFAKIARTTVRAGDQSYGSITIDHGNTSLTIVSKGGITAEGVTLDKIGNTSGWTSGSVLSTCDDRHIDGFIILCADKIDMISDPGDSGSPVFALLENGEVALRGIVFGHEDEFLGGENDALVSDYHQIEKDLGALSVAVNPEINGPSQVDPNTIETWTASVTGGAPPYSYEWYRTFPDGSKALVSSTDEYTGGTGDGFDFQLELEVTDTDGLPGTTLRQVIVGGLGGGGGCSTIDTTNANYIC